MFAAGLSLAAPHAVGTAAADSSDRGSGLAGYTAVLANLSGSSIDPSSSVFVL
ncbi:hypothetical protein [Mycolicibacterium sarraceniae]|uniref:Uncharacterized protein n=1 Tax=Mycolicibacterium sarraceniae TaxID=1534348 RepID=A0A7I7SWJ7_9MYCO|nr:hypothetical protein [Mycolicibacterium sarraceniae]BBY60691.1 hypothetical protein MSAR_38270 [Mycolicibacterium sarraceniae]